MKNKLIYTILFLKGRAGTDIKELSQLLNKKQSETKQYIESLREELKELD